MVSIVTPVYNAREYIKETIDSVLSQTYQDFEWFLVEDCSSDGTTAYLQELLEKLGDSRLHYVQQPSNRGAAEARNRGVELASGRYLAFLDADDLWMPNKLERQVKFIEEKDVAFVFTGYEFGDEQARGTGHIVKVPEKLTYPQALKNTTIFTSTVMFDTEKIAKKDLAMPKIKSEDTALWWKILKQGYMAYGLNENLTVYRRPAKSLSSNKLEAIRRIWNLYRKQENLGFLYSTWNFCFWAVRAVFRRI